VAPDLIGCRLVRNDGGLLRVGRVVETEAYVGEHDLACHARAGRTPRTEVMYGEPGHAYVYFIYGVHPMLNVVCGPGGYPNAVLIRAAEPVESLLHSASGPGNLTKAFNIQMRHNRVDLCDAGGELYFAARAEGDEPRLWRSPRVGVDYAGKWAKALLRYCDRDSKSMSRPRPPVRRTAR
jgi:DNA-3-methyladenine glycosylase